MTTRNVRPFVHLRVLSWYSMGLGHSSPAEICRHARRVGFESVALTDVSGTYGFVEFHRAAREVGVKPIYGVLLYLDWSNPPAAGDPVHSLVLLALDRPGLRSVCGAATRSATRRERGGAFHAADLEPYADGVVGIADIDALAAGVDVAHVLLPLQTLLGDRLFVACRDGPTGERAELQSSVLAASQRLGVSPVLVQDVRFVGPPRPQLIDIVDGVEDGAFERGAVRDTRARAAEAADGMRTAAEMSQAYDALPEAHANAALIASLVQPDLFDALEAAPAASRAVEMFDADRERATTLRAHVAAALDRVRAGRGEDVAAALRPSVDAELAMVERSGTAGALLQFEDIVARLRAAGVTLGPSTGLALQSRCAYLLGITAFDPYGIDPGFQPAFAVDPAASQTLDIQVPPEQRPRVLATLNNVFDGASMGYVPSVEHVTAARALRLVARRMGVDPKDYEDAVRIATRHYGMSLRELSEENRAIGALYRRSARFRELVAHAAAIEGLPFGFVRTKRTVVVSPRPLRAMLGYTINPKTGDHFVQATRDAFPFGMIRRIDVGTLHVLAWVDMGEGTPGADDRDPYRLVADGDLDGVHLLEGAPGQLAPSFGVESFDDLVRFVAVLRWRETGMFLPERLKSFRGERPEIPAADRVAAVLDDTNGWVLFRDQVRDVIARLTGLGPSEALAMLARFRDHTPGNLATLRREFLALTVEVPIAMDDATAWFARLLRLSRRAIDRQGVVAECLVIHRCLRAKTADRLAFFARLLDHTYDDRKRRRYESVLQSEGKWLGADVNRSGRRHRVENGSVRAPLWSVPGVSVRDADTVIRMRGKKRYANAHEFRCAAEDAGINLEVVDALVRVGAIGSALEQGQSGATPLRRRRSPAPDSEQIGLDIPSIQASATHPSTPPSGRTPTEKDGNTKGGFLVVPSLLEFYPHPSATPVELAGRIRNLHEFKSSSGKTIGFFELFDSSGSVRVFVPWERVVHTGEPVSDGSHATVKGKVRQRDGRKVCDALEIVVTEGGNGHGETSPDEPAEGDP